MSQGPTSFSPSEFRDDMSSKKALDAIRCAVPALLLLNSGYVRDGIIRAGRIPYLNGYEPPGSYWVSSSLARLDSRIGVELGYPIFGDWEVDSLNDGSVIATSKRLSRALDILKRTGIVVKIPTSSSAYSSSFSSSRSYIAERLLKDGYYDIDPKRVKEIETSVVAPLENFLPISKIPDLILNHTIDGERRTTFTPPWELVRNFNVGRLAPVPDEAIYASLMASLMLKFIVPLKTTAVAAPMRRKRFLPKTSRWESLYRENLTYVIREGSVSYPTKGATLRVEAHKFELDNPRDRLLLNPARSFNLPQALGHTRWVLGGREDLASISYYNPRALNFSSDGKILGGAYGPRLFGERHGMQFEYVKNLLKTSPWTRNAFLQIYDPTRDHHGRADEKPCTADIQFIASDHQLDMIVHMRSQNLLAVLPIDLFMFTFIHEYMARLTGYPLGRYLHFMGDAHIYIDDLPWCKKILSSPDVPSNPMPEMPSTSPDLWLGRLMDFEEKVRNAVTSNNLRPIVALGELSAFPTYWKQLGLVFLETGCIKAMEYAELSRLQKLLKDPYSTFLGRTISGSPIGITRS